MISFKLIFANINYYRKRVLDYKGAHINYGRELTISIKYSKQAIE